MSEVKELDVILVEAEVVALCANGHYAICRAVTAGEPSPLFMVETDKVRPAAPPKEDPSTP